MRAFLRVLSALLLITAAAWWWKAGSHTGWTKTTDRIWKYDEVTEISYPETVERFVPGVDLLAAAALGSAVLASASFLFRRKSPDATAGGPS